MKFHIRKRYLFLILLTTNLLLFATFFIVLILIKQNEVINVENITSSLPFFDTSVNKLRVNSKAFIIYDTLSRAVIAGKNERFRFAPASTAKIMTATLVLEHYPLNQILTVKGMENVEGSKMNLVEGEEITVLNLLYGLMLPSGNDAAWVLSDNYPGGREVFIQKMNDKAKELSLNNTRFIDPAGYEDNNYSTALDLARLASYAIQNKNFSKIVSTKNIIVTDFSGIIVHPLENLNTLLGKNGVNGIKTGYTDEAGGVLVTSLTQNGRTYIIVVLNSPDRLLDTKLVIEEAISKIKLLSY